FDALRARLRLTWAGQMLLGDARRVLATVDHAIQAIQATQGAAHRHLRQSGPAANRLAAGAQPRGRTRAGHPRLRAAVIAIRPLAGVTPPTLTTYLLRRQGDPSEPMKRFLLRVKNGTAASGD
ncbi:MAG: hypothetical protein LBP52_10670, partial [Burkholderiaceae bacterium]|nr:hypothetical protein [Burkholderiaceae bacterium]